jgi:hypothetical protein
MENTLAAYSVVKRGNRPGDTPVRLEQHQGSWQVFRRSAVAA